MKKVLTVLLIISILMSLSVSIVLAEGSKNNNPGNETTSKAPAQSQGNSGEAQATMNQYMARFESDQLEMTALKAQTRAQLMEQVEITDATKLQLRTMNQAYLSMTDEERALCQSDIDSLKSQIRSAHRYALQIEAAGDQLRSRLQDCVPDGTPTATEVEDTTEILDEL